MIKLLLALTLAAGVAGCASGNPKVFARRDPAHRPSVTNTIAIAAHPQPRPEDIALDEALKAELTRRGFQLRPAAAADYVLACWAEENWRSMRSVGGVNAGAPVGVVTYEGSPITAPGSLSVGVSADGRMERYLVSQGIRLELYPRSSNRTANLTPAWVGVIEGGSQVKPAEHPALLQTLLDYFGQDFTGRAKRLDDQ